MPTSTEVFADVAARFGGVDPHDPDAVRQWYETKMPTLPPEQIDEILDELLQKEGTGAHSLPRCYPPSAPLPTLDEAPPAPLPLFFVAFLRNLLALLRKG